MKLSFIIPALNEYKHLPRTLEAVHTAMAGHTGYEIILCDNGSSDGTPELARERGCKVLQAPGATIARLRNLGVAASDGDLLIFIDSDVSLAPDWFTVLQKVCSSADNNTITGSKCRPPADVKAFIVSNWFALLPDSNQNYINSGHLIVPRQVHDRIGGFDESLRTGEDYDYCQRARQQGVNIRVQPELRAYHYGFPLRIRDFIAREAWHGRHDVASVPGISGFQNGTGRIGQYRLCIRHSGKYGAAGFALAALGSAAGGTVLAPGTDPSEIPQPRFHTDPADLGLF